MRILGRNALGTASGLVGGLMLAGGAAVAQEVTLNVWSDPVRLTMFDLYDKTHDNVKLNVTTIDRRGSWRRSSSACSRSRKCPTSPS